MKETKKETNIQLIDKQINRVLIQVFSGEVGLQPLFDDSQ